MSALSAISVPQFRHFIREVSFLRPGGHQIVQASGYEAKIAEYIELMKLAWSDPARGSRQRETLQP